MESREPQTRNVQGMAWLLELHDREETRIVTLKRTLGYIPEGAKELHAILEEVILLLRGVSVTEDEYHAAIDLYEKQPVTA